MKCKMQLWQSSKIRKTVCFISYAMMMAFILCSCSNREKTTDMDIIRSAAAAKLETEDNHTLYVDSEIDIVKSFADLEIHEAPLEPQDKEDDWIYRITFNPSEKVSGGEEVVVAFHDTYVQINSEYYLGNEGVPYDEILDWAQSKFAYFFE